MEDRAYTDPEIEVKSYYNEHGYWLDIHRVGSEERWLLWEAQARTLYRRLHGALEGIHEHRRANQKPRRREAQTVTGTCEHCSLDFTYTWAGYGPGPRYCPDCRTLVRRAQTRERMQRWRENHRDGDEPICDAGS